MTTYRSKSFLITRRTFAASLLASGALGIGIGEVAGPLAQSQAQPLAVAAKAPAACATSRPAWATRLSSSARS